MRLGRRDPAGADLRGVAAGDRADADGRDRRHRDAAHLHRRPRGRDPPRRHRQAGAGLRGPGDRRRGPAVPAGRARPPRGARPDRLPLPRGRAPDPLRHRRLERHRRHLLPGRGRLLLVPGPQRRHDRLGRLQHRRAGGGGEPARPPGGGRVRRGGGARRRARPHRQGLRGARRRLHRRRRPGRGAAGARQARPRALQVSPRRRLRAGAPEDRIGKLQRFALRQQAEREAANQGATP